ncbi:MAG: hypothetical protein M1831_005850 [Alyxoria varia]|nr:MAG: hypothetical protein M1831_005850 [Alyxoria varia]
MEAASPQDSLQATSSSGVDHITANPTSPASSLSSPANVEGKTKEQLPALEQDSSGSEKDADGDSYMSSDVDKSSSALRSMPPGSKRRRSSESENAFIQSNPELYGLRRSHRPNKPNNQVVESDSDEDSDIIQKPAPKRRQVKKATKSQTVTPRALSESDDDDSDNYVRRRRQAAKTKKNRLQSQPKKRGSTSTSSPYMGPVRASSRQAGKVATYKEDDADGTDEDEVASWTIDYGQPKDTIQHIFAFDFVEGHDGKFRNKDCIQLLIKWEGKSNYAATWETFESLKDVKGLTKAHNFHKERIVTLLDGSLDSEEKAAKQAELVSMREQFEKAKNVHRVIAERTSDDDVEYLVKWDNVGYADSTWEPSDFVQNIASEQIEAFLNRKPPTIKRDETRPMTRAKLEKLDLNHSPEFIKGPELFPFQVDGVNFIARSWYEGKNAILADEMGLGKTVQTVTFLSWLKNIRGVEGPFLVVIPLSTKGDWIDAFERWAPDLNVVVYMGKPEDRRVIQQYELFENGKPKFNVLLTTPEYVQKDQKDPKEAAVFMPVDWQGLVVDEAHRLKNRNSKFYEQCSGLNTAFKLLLTGTPLQNTLEELSALLDFVAPEDNVVQYDKVDYNDELAAKQLAEVRDAIDPYMFRRTKKVLTQAFPPKTEKILRVELSQLQLEYYQNILTHNYAALTEAAQGGRVSLNNIMMELKKASNHPYLFPNAEERLLNGSERRDDILRNIITSSGKMMLLDRLLEKLKKDGHRVLIFSQYVKMLDILSRYLKARNYKFQRLDGTVPSQKRANAIASFNHSESEDFAFLLTPRAGGQGINLATADTVVLFDSDWNPQVDIQAMSRAHRIGQTRPVSVHRFVSKDTVEEEVLQRARNKLLLDYITIQKGVTENSEKAFLMEKMAQTGRSFQAAEESGDIDQILKQRSQKMFEQTDNQQKLETLNIDAVLADAEINDPDKQEEEYNKTRDKFFDSFQYSDVNMDNIKWDDIIPKEEIEKMQAAEEEEKQNQQLLKLHAEAGPRKRAKEAHETAKTKDDRADRVANKRAREVADLAAQEEEQVQQLDPSRPLNDKECRALIGAYQSFGSMADRQTDILQDARLGDRDLAVVNATLDEFVTMASDKVQNSNQENAAKEGAGQKLTKKEQKAVVFDHRGVKRINANTLLERPNRMKMLRDVINDCGEDWADWRVPEASKPAQYTSDWGAREDAMLCIGINRHGFGSWRDIQRDTTLGMVGKFFLDEHQVAQKQEREKADDQDEKLIRSPGAVHLVRRAEYLLSCLKHHTSNGTDPIAKQELDNHHRNNKKHASAVQGASNNFTSGGSGEPGQRKPLANGTSKQHKSSLANHRQSSSGTPPLLAPPSKLGKRKSDGDDGESRKKARKLHDTNQNSRTAEKNHATGKNNISQSTNPTGKKKSAPNALKRKADDSESDDEPNVRKSKVHKVDGQKPRNDRKPQATERQKALDHIMSTDKSSKSSAPPQLGKDMEGKLKEILQTLKESKSSIWKEGLGKDRPTQIDLVRPHWQLLDRTIKGEVDPRGTQFANRFFHMVNAPHSDYTFANKSTTKHFRERVEDGCLPRGTKPRKHKTGNEESDGAKAPKSVEKDPTIKQEPKVDDARKSVGKGPTIKQEPDVDIGPKSVDKGSTTSPPKLQSPPSLIKTED